MKIEEHVSLAPFTTFHIGGSARVLAEATTLEEVHRAIAYARERSLPLYVIGAGSNVLVSDAGVEGMVLKMSLRDIVFKDEGDSTLLIAGAGALWEDIVDAASERDLFGIENLAGIPGTLGGAVVQNIGAYGVELAQVLKYADCIDSTTGAPLRMGRAEAAFSYRNSFFKKNRNYIIVSAALKLSKQGLSNLAYTDLARAQAEGISLKTPRGIAGAIRAIRSQKFPDLAREGCAGSFFKNPILTESAAGELQKRFPGLPSFPQGNGLVKISLAWLLDKGLSLKGFSKGNVRLYENQPLVVTARSGATAKEVDAFATEIAERVFNTTGITIEREVETFGAQKKCKDLNI